ncbi:MAG: ABC-F family ATP-binding cassette domain-containing protein [Anaerolineaceae bacterium]|nr:ABC-F family ATP-binding cassette domain-containing protein [Anaerolineaceae bacterium]
MPLISVSNLSKSFGPDDIFDQITFSIPYRARIGLVGSNGVGKTTLLKMLIGIEEISDGDIYKARNIKIGYLPQNAEFDSKKTLWDECLTAFTPLLKMQKDLASLESQMSASNESEAQEAIQSYGPLQEKFERLGGYTFENRIKQTLTGLSFTAIDLNRPLNQLSGGQRTRAFLGKLLLSDPDLLLLDEPTNHLDISAIEWLESYLKDWEGSVMIVSHDRYFLDEVANLIWEMTPQLEFYKGNYSAYNMQRGERYRRRLEEFKKQQAFIEKEEEYIRRNIAGQNTRQAQGRRKRLERLLKESKLVAPIESHKLRLRLEPSGRSGDQVLKTKNLHLGYADDGKVLFQSPDLLLERGECAAIIGPNGAGKTTFLKTILGQLPPLKGESNLGASLQIGYFAQAHEDLNPNLTLMEEINLVEPKMLPAEIRNYLATFLFTEDDVFKKVEVLSGGERGRLALACLALQGANLLLLDEPTNHLDLPSQEILQSILREFNGTILLVSHDRYLIDALASQIWEVNPADKNLIIFKGSYSQYKEKVLSFAAEAEETANIEKKSTRQRQVKTGLSKHEIKKRRERIEILEKRIAQLEEQMETVSKHLENPPESSEKIQQLSLDYQQFQELLEEKMNEWSELSESLESID